ncbi:MAG: 3-dehydroquinate synthase [Agitococcus sp.]|jgi:3-dehydroquinate synthase|nr:3-dehydroquinate synthase [Moraxellaceae bacterium]MBK8325995.1 3-dehydroquinate synthase [Moraxellaceae bacterium]MBP9217092.1 3-dehydroquinate synthase [Agitococcus sp.]MCC6375187.1 3-dehydroquinate synthase [Moraxellaceae bacterium]HQV79920.1 3-dehydroquinate synthase [Agitococcus sp.]
MQTLTVSLNERSYPIFIGESLLTQAVCYQSYLQGKQVLIVSNTTVAPLYLAQVENTLNTLGYQVASYILPDGEQFKNMAHVESIFTQLLEKRFNRDCALVALGGGVVGDMTGFAAACYQRGVSFLQIPTTLLAQVDSSVGGKTGVNHPLGKNMIGAFKQPNAVLADTSVLDTLNDREYAAGLAEVIKYGLIRDEPFLDWLEQNMADLVARDKKILAEAITRSCQNKADVVAADELEANDVRALLNLGHTFGHAIETAMGYGVWLHGEAVATGMLMAADLSWRLGWLTQDEVLRVKRILLAAQLPIIPPIDISPEQFLQLMAVDKKVLAGKLRLVLLQKLGQALVTADFPLATLVQTLSAGEHLGCDDE